LLRETSYGWRFSPNALAVHGLPTQASRSSSHWRAALQVLPLALGFPGSAALWAVKALEYAPQLMTYAMAIEMSGGLIIGRFIHFTVGGGLVEVAAT